MAAFKRLIVGDLSDIGEHYRVRLNRGLLKSDFLPGPFAQNASQRARSSVLQCNTKLPTLLVLPAEILKMVLGRLEPIWLFQAEAAYPEIAALSSILNSVWYEILPPALFAEPEHFQDEAHVALVRSEFSRGEVDCDEHDHTPSRLSGTRYYWPESPRNKMVQLPVIADMTELAMKVEWSYDLKHPEHTSFYPLIPTGNGSFRIRNLALGGAFQPEIDYRKEIAGSLHYRKRCQICASLVGTLRPFRQEFGVIFCVSCHKSYTLTQDQIQEIPGLDKLLASSEDPNWKSHRRLTTYVQWRPLVDDVLRKKLGLDFETASAKQKYLSQLLATSKMLKRPTESNHRQLRHELVQVAKKYWTFGTADTNVNETIKFARSTFAPTAILEQFLFPARSLDGALLTLPYDDSEGWLEDPTMKLKSSREIFTRTAAWKAQAALQMVNKLCDFGAETYYFPGEGGSVTAWIKASDQYQVQRMENSITADFAIAKLQQAGRASYFRDAASGDQSNNYSSRFHRLSAILTKLHIPPMQPLIKNQLSDYELSLAKDIYFKKLLSAACAGCPNTGLLAFPRGYTGIIKHFRRCHYNTYWRHNDWLIIG